MANYKELDETLALVKNLATTEQIQNLLRTRRESVRITGENKDQIVDRNLREAVESRALSIERVFDLIRDAEENGNQHIFYYKVKSRAIAEALAFENIAPQLFGSGWQKKLDEDFPQIKLRPNDFKVSDFRQLQKKPRDWVFKIYGETVTWSVTDQRTEDGGIWKFYAPASLRIVLLARWNSPDLLEIRVQRSSSRKRVEEWHNTVWERLKPRIIRSQFTPWELSQAMKNLLDKQSGYKSIYHCSDAEVTDRHGNHATFGTELETGDLFASTEVRQSLQGFVKANSEFDDVIVTWLQQANNIPSKDMRTIVGVRQSQEMQQRLAAQTNEIIVQAHCAAEDLDYATGQLRSFNK